MDSLLTENLKHLPEKSRNVIIEFTDKLVEAFQNKLESVILFGSASDGDFIEGKSDINILIILQNVGAVDLNILMNLGKKYARKGLAIPLIFEKDHVATSLDTFPMEFSDMKQRHILLHGTDPLKDAIIENKNLRYQCERELKSMLVNLRRGFLRTEGRKENLENLLSSSLSTVLAACRGMIWLAKKTPSNDIEKLLSEIHSVYNIEIAAIDRVRRLRKGHAEATATLETLFDAYTNDIEQLANIVDKL
jgi:predicted nucleotidyltransferase